MSERVRVKDKATGHKYSELASVVEANPDAYQVLKQDAEVNGEVVPPEFAETSEPAKTTSKENS